MGRISMKIPIIKIFLLVVCAVNSFAQQAAFIASKEQDCSLLKTTFDASSSTGEAPLSYFWDFGNGNSISGQDKAIVDAIYVEAGTPEVTLYVVDAKGNRSPSVSRKLHILEGPKVDFTVNSMSTCTGKPLQFTNLTQEGSSPITGYIWNIGNATLREKNPSYSFGATGTYDVTLIATDANGCNVSLKKERMIKVENSFNAWFSADSTFSCNAPFTAKFHDYSNYGKVSDHPFDYKWTFSDGTSSTERHPVKIFSLPGKYSVSLFITDKSNGCGSLFNMDEYVVVGGKTARSKLTLESRNCYDFSYNINPNDEGLPKRFVRTVDLGDGTIRTLNGESSFSHVYRKPGKYVIKTSFVDPNDMTCSQIGYDTLTVPSLNVGILADTTRSCQLPFTVSFGTKNLSDALYYEWNFGDGSTSSLANPQKTYTTKGIFDVTLKAWSLSGCVYTLEKKAFIQTGKMDVAFTTDAQRIQQLPKGFETHPLNDSSALWGGCLPFSVTFKNTSSNAAGTVYRWDFGDGQSSSSGQTPTHVYTQEGVFSPLLIATDKNGCIDTATCEQCVRVGAPPKVTVGTGGPDTVCCLYDKSFKANIDLKDIDLLWYNIDLDDGFNPALTLAHYKDRNGNWVVEDNTESIYPYDTSSLLFRYGQTNFASPATGNYPDLYFYAYKNGCSSKVELPNYQKHVLPWGTFAPLPCEQEQNLKAGDTLDFNKVGGNWILGKDNKGNPMKLSRAVVKFEFSGPSGCTMPDYEQTYTPASLGFELDGLPFEKIKAAGLFPKIAIPACAQKGDALMTTTYLYTHDDAQKYYRNDKCLCEEHWPYTVGGPVVPVELSAKKGCAPLEVTFKSANEQKWEFEDGTALNGKQVKRNFSKPGIYRFKSLNANCSASTWTDSILVYENPVSHFKMNQRAFCLNDDTINTSNKTLVLTDSSYSKKDTLIRWDWDFGNGQTLSSKNNSKQSVTFSQKDVPVDPKKGVYARLTVTDNHGCQAQDSLAFILRSTKPAFTLTKAAGCYDTLKVLPTFPQMGAFSPYIGKLKIDFISGPTAYPLHEDYLVNVSSKSYLLQTNGQYRVRMQIDYDGMGACPSIHDTLIAVAYQDLIPDFQTIGRTKFSCVPAMVQLKDSSKVNGLSIKSWSWTIVNKATKSELNGSGPMPAPFALTDSGYYYAYLTVKDQKGCQKSVYKDSVFYINELKGKIDSISPPLCPGEVAYFKGSSSNASNYFWDFGDGTVVDGLEARHSYMSVGDRYVSFIVTDSSNCRKSYTGKLTMKPAPTFDLGKDTLLCKDAALLLQGPEKPMYAYQWNTGAKTPSISIDKAGRYALSVWDTTLHCPFRDSISVQVSTPPKVRIEMPAPMCKGERITLKATKDSMAMRLAWEKNGITIGRSDLLTLEVQDIGPIVLEAYNQDNCATKDSLTLPMLERPVMTLSDQNICPGDSILLQSKVSFAHPLFHYAWSFNGTSQRSDTISSIKAKEEGTYRVTYGKPNCETSVSAQLRYNPLPDPGSNLPKVILCEENESVELDAGISNSYYWLPNGEKQRFLRVDKVGEYVVQIANKFECKVYDTIRVENRCPPKLYVPTAFTPEQIGENQVYTIFGYNIGTFEMLIYNRWGELVYKTNDLHQPWTGYYKGELMPSGVYPWIITYSGNNPDHRAVQQMEGKVVLVR